MNVFKPVRREIGTHPKYKVERIEFHTPSTVATVIERQDDGHVWVRCEGEGCTNVITIGKRHWRPVDFSDPDGAHVEVRLTDAPARRCAGCGPFPKSS